MHFSERSRPQPYEGTPSHAKMRHRYAKWKKCITQQRQTPYQHAGETVYPTEYTIGGPALKFALGYEEELTKIHSLHTDTGIRTFKPNLDEAMGKRDILIKYLYNNPQLQHEYKTFAIAMLSENLVCDVLNKYILHNLPLQAIFATSEIDKSSYGNHGKNKGGDIIIVEPGKHALHPLLILDVTIGDASTLKKSGINQSVGSYVHPVYLHQTTFPVEQKNYDIRGYIEEVLKQLIALGEYDPAAYLTEKGRNALIQKIEDDLYAATQVDIRDEIIKKRLTRLSHHLTQ